MDYGVKSPAAGALVIIPAAAEQTTNNKQPAEAIPMQDFEQDNPRPQGDLAMHITALPRDTNGFGDIHGGWLVSQMDLAGTAMASRIAGGRVATVAIDRMAFMVPVAVGAQLSFYAQTVEIGRSSIKLLIEVWNEDPLSSEWRKVTEALCVFVAIDGGGRTRPVPQR
jgi:acyl-CoA thioesterase YciA